MNPLLIGPIAELLKTIVGKIWPDPAKQQEAAAALLKMQQDGDLAQLDAQVKLALAQTDVNKVEAASSNLFTSGWRPGAGWACVFGLWYAFLLQPLMVWASSYAHVPVPPPLDMATLLELLGGMLGLGTLRTIDKKNGTAS